MKTKIVQNIKSIILALILVVGVSYVSAASWSDPTANPPLNNADKPLDVSVTAQAKRGKLAIGTAVSPVATMDVTGTIFTTGGATLNTSGAINGLIVEKGKTTLKGAVQITSGTPGAGKVLTSDASGNASWATTVGGGYTGQLWSCSCPGNPYLGGSVLNNTNQSNIICDVGYHCAGCHTGIYWQCTQVQ